MVLNKLQEWVTGVTNRWPAYPLHLEHKGTTHKIVADWDLTLPNEKAYPPKPVYAFEDGAVTNATTNGHELTLTLANGDLVRIHPLEPIPVLVKGGARATES